MKAVPRTSITPLADWAAEQRERHGETGEDEVRHLLTAWASALTMEGQRAVSRTLRLMEDDAQTSARARARRDELLTWTYMVHFAELSDREAADRIRSIATRLHPDRRPAQSPAAEIHAALVAPGRRLLSAEMIRKIIAASVGKKTD